MSRTSLHLAAALAACVPIGLTGSAAWGADASTGDCGPGTVKVCGQLTLTNNTGQPATDFHFYMYQNDRPSVQVMGASVSASGCGSASVALGTDDGTNSPPPGNHGAQVDVDGCTVPAGGSINLNICLCMNERNCIKFKDIQWTNNAVPQPPDPGNPPPKKGGWRIHRPYRGGRGGSIAPNGGGKGKQEGGGGAGFWVHQVCWENDSDEWMIIDELKLLASMAAYPPGSIDWSPILPIADPAHPYPICVPPGGKYCYNFETIGSYVGGHVYQKWTVRMDTTGFCSSPRPETEAPLDAMDAGAPPVIIGDHPVEAEMTDCLTGRDYLTTTTPTHITCGTPFIPQIPANFFGPGSEPFTGTIPLQGVPLGGPFGNADTVIQRNEIAYLDLDGSTATIPIEMVQMDLRSVEPIVVVAPTTGASLWDVLPGLNQTLIGQPPTQSHLSHDGGVTPAAVLKHGLPNATPGSQMRLQAIDSGGGPGIYGIDSFFDVFYQVAPPFPSTRFFDVFTELSPLPGIGTYPMGPPVLSYTPGNSFFDITYGDIFMGPVTQKLTLRVDMEPTQPVTLLGVSMLGIDGQSHLTMRLQLNVTGPVNIGSRICRGHMLGEQMQLLPSFFDVFVTLDPDLPALGSMNITRNDLTGGTFSTSLMIKPRITFRRTGDGPGDPTWTLPGVLPYNYFQPTPHGWTYESYPGAPGAGGPNFFVSPEPLQWLSPDGSPHTVLGAIVPPAVTQWRSVRTHAPGAPNGPLAIVLHPTATGNGLSGPTVETRRFGIQRVEVDFDQPVMIAPLGSVALTGHLTVGGVMQPMQNFGGNILGFSMMDADTLQILLNAPPNEGCYRFDIANAVRNLANMAPAGDTDCNVRSLAGDATGDGLANLGDALRIKVNIGTAAATAPQWDLNVTGGNVDLGDALFAKSQVNRNARCP